MENLINAGKVTMQLFYTGGPPLVRFFLGPKNRTIRGLPVRLGYIAELKIVTATTKDSNCN